jgi:RNA polymerase-binding transcription factor DksA
MAQTKAKSPFTKDELKKWRKLLISRREQISTNITDLYQDVMDSEDGHTLPTHQADRGSDSSIQDISLGIMDDEETLLWQIERALRKIDEQKPLPFGLCEHTQKAIPKSRLNLLPWTPLSIEGATYMEDEGLTLQDMLIND